MPSGSTPATVHRLRDDGVVVIGEEEHEATCRRRGEATQALEVAATTAYISPRRVPQPRVHGFLVATMASPHRTKSNQIKSIDRTPPWTLGTRARWQEDETPSATCGGGGVPAAAARVGGEARAGVTGKAGLPAYPVQREEWGRGRERERGRRKGEEEGRGCLADVAS
uniref:Uncharacterized protein n=1 Tax=Oryza barthii TaxID=65489 RepID=A0A0D3FPQ6_9ORYZ